MIIYNNKVYTNNLFIEDDAVGPSAWKHYFIVFLSICNKYLLPRRNRGNIRIWDENNTPLEKNTNSIRRTFSGELYKNYLRVREEEMPNYFYLEFRYDLSGFLPGNIDIGNIDSPKDVSKEYLQNLFKIHSIESTDFKTVLGKVNKFQPVSISASYKKLALLANFEGSIPDTYAYNFKPEPDREDWKILIWSSRDTDLGLETNLVDQVHISQTTYVESEVLIDFRRENFIFLAICRILTYWCEEQDKDHMTLFILMILTEITGSTYLSQYTNNKVMLKKLDKIAENQSLDNLKRHEVVEIQSCLVYKYSSWEGTESYSSLVAILSDLLAEAKGYESTVRSRSPAEVSILNCTMHVLFKILKGLPIEAIKKFRKLYGALNPRENEIEILNSKQRGIRWARVAALSVQGKNSRVESLINLIKYYRLKNFYTEDLIINNPLVESMFVEKVSVPYSGFLENNIEDIPIEGDPEIILEEMAKQEDKAEENNSTDLSLSVDEDGYLPNNEEWNF